MKKTKKELILEGFQKMDSTMLEVLLDDSKTYQNATKEVFLEKLNTAFSKLKENGDTLLLLHKGLCNSNECPNKGCSGYSFVGNNSKKHIDLIFDELVDDVKDIYHCNGFETDDKSVKTEESIDIDIMKDEEADFKPSVDFLIESQKCRLAYEELMQYQNTIISKELYCAWLEKHNELYRSLGFISSLYYTDFDKFHTLYYGINELKDFLQSNDIAREAVEEFQTIDKNSEPQLLKWLVKYEDASENFSLFLYIYWYPKNSKYYEVNDLKINTSDFKHIAKFKFLFDEYYHNMLKKYTTFSADEVIQYINENSEIAKYAHSLSYHLNKRKIVI